MGCLMILLVVTVSVPTSLLAQRTVSDLPHGAYRPCALNDYSCIGKVLNRNSNCTLPVEGYIPPTFVIPEFGFEAPYFNASYVEKKLIIRKFNLCYVAEFYINKITDKAVLGVDCPQKDDEADRWMYQHRSLREDDVYKYHYRGIWPLIRCTVVMPRTNMNPLESKVFTEVYGSPDLRISPRDRPTSKHLSTDPSLLSVFDIESFSYRGTPIVRDFVQAMLCDYGRTVGWKL